jgi:sensor histidine kinase regulating citrate/malate metabolism
LRWKLVIFVVALILCVSIFFLVYIPAQIERYAGQALKNKGRFVTATTATNVTPAMVFEDTIQINEELRTAQLSPDLMYAVVHDTLGRRRASWQMQRALAVEYEQTLPEGDLFENVALRLSAPLE